MTTDIILNVLFSAAFFNQWPISATYCKTVPFCEFVEVVPVSKSSLCSEATAYIFMFMWDAIVVKSENYYRHERDVSS
jgi:hypothetical protein